MARTRTEELINDLSDAQKTTLRAAQFGYLTDDVDRRTFEVLLENDLVQTVEMTHPRVYFGVSAVVLTEQGNQVVEEIKAREQAEEARQAAENPPKAEKQSTPKKKASTGNSKK